MGPSVQGFNLVLEVRISEVIIEIVEPQSNSALCFLRAIFTLIVRIKLVENVVERAVATVIPCLPTAFLRFPNFVLH